jgi:transposase InsO family protein
VVTRAFLHPLEIATAPFEVIGMDFLGPIKPESLNGNKHVLVITDAFSKWTEVVALPDQTAETTCRALMDRIILYHGPPKIIVTDRGSNFTSRLFNSLCKELKTKHKTTTAYHPQSNGMTERFKKTVVEMVRKYIDDGFENWEEVDGFGLQKFSTLFNDGESIFSNTGKRPQHGNRPIPNPRKRANYATRL